MAQFIALIHKEADSDYGVHFPDLPGLATAAATLDEARAFAEEALALHLEGMAQDGDPIPEPSTLEAVMTDPENRNGVAILVQAETRSRAVRVNITLPEDALREIDTYAEAHGFTRSGFLTQAARKLMQSA